LREVGKRFEESKVYYVKREASYFRGGLFIDGVEMVYSRIVDFDSKRVIEVDWNIYDDKGEWKRILRARVYSDVEFSRLQGILSRKSVFELPWTKEQFDSLYLDVSQLETFARAVKCAKERINPVLDAII